MSGLTDTEIKRAKATEKAYSMGDGGGLYLWVKPTGSNRPLPSRLPRGASGRSTARPEMSRMRWAGGSPSSAVDAS